MQAFPLIFDDYTLGYAPDVSFSIFDDIDPVKPFDDDLPPDETGTVFQTLTPTAQSGGCPPGQQLVDLGNGNRVCESMPEPSPSPVPPPPPDQTSTPPAPTAGFQIPDTILGFPTIYVAAAAVIGFVVVSSK